MIILIPERVYDDFAPAAQAVAPYINCLPYGDDEPAPPGLADADAIYWWFTVKHLDRLLAGGRRVRWLQTGSAGVDRLLPILRDYPNLQVTDSGPAFEVTIPEFVLAWILSVARRLPIFAAQQQAHLWRPVDQDELWGRTVGIVGIGPIGRGVATRARAFGMRTIGLRRRPETSTAVDETVSGTDGLAYLLRESDYVVIATALTDETHAMIGAAELGSMKSTAWIINIARGAIIDEVALIVALRANTIAGACLDVFQREPLPPENPLWDMPNVHIAPHNSSDSSGTRDRQKQVFLNNLRRFVNNDPLHNIVDVSRGY